MLKIYYRATANKTPSLLNEFKHSSWVNLYDPSEAEIDEVVETLGVDKSLLSDSLDINEVPRLERDGKTTYIYVRVPEKTKNGIITVPLLIVIGSGFVLTVSSQKCSLLNKFILGDIAYSTTHQTKFILQLFFALNENYNNLIIEINKRLRNIKVRLNKINSKDLVQFVDFEQVLNDFLSALVPINSVFQNILSGRHFELGEDDKDLTEDIILGSNQLIELSKSSLRYTVNIRDTYSNIATHDLNRIMKILTVLTILLTIPNAVFGFFGMNVSIPGAQLSFTYLWIIFSTLAFLGFLLFIFIRNRWL